MYSKIKNAIYYLSQDPKVFIASVWTKLAPLFPDKIYLKVLFRIKMGYWMDFNNPKTFTEKIQWLKLYNRNPEYTTMVDKAAVKNYVAAKIGKDYVIPTLRVWESPDEIDFDSLPKQFVLKTTHGGGSGGVVICKNKRKLDRDKAINKLRNGMKSNIYRNSREWPYKNVKKQIIAEQYMMPRDKEDDPTYDLTDYKFYCFNGDPIYCQVIRDRHTSETIDFYDMDWNLQEFVGLNPVEHLDRMTVAHNGKIPVDCPEKLTEMKDLCKKLAKDIPFVRIDLYLIDKQIYFGEITFYPASGIGVFDPQDWDKKLGDLIKINSHF